MTMQHISTVGGQNRTEDRDRGSLTISLEGGHLVGLENARGTIVHLLAGQLWITQAGDYRDFIVEPGQRLRLDSDGLVLVTAVHESALTITSEDGAMLSRLQFDRNRR